MNQLIGQHQWKPQVSWTYLAEATTPVQRDPELVQREPTAQQDQLQGIPVTTTEVQPVRCNPWHHVYVIHYVRLQKSQIKINYVLLAIWKERYKICLNKIICTNNTVSEVMLVSKGAWSQRWENWLCTGLTLKLASGSLWTALRVAEQVHLSSQAGYTTQHFYHVFAFAATFVMGFGI